MTKEEREADNKRIQDYINTPGKLPMSKFNPNFKFTINRGTADFELDDFLDETYYKLDFDVYLPSKGMNLQRPLVWTQEQKIQLIFSVLKGIYIPPITIVRHRGDTEKQSLIRIIDGKQRLSTLLSFFKGEFKIPFEGAEYGYDDLTNEAKRRIKGCLRVDVGYSYPDSPISDNDLIAWFDLINFAGTPQDAEHIKKLKSI
jgi:hypothetical protein